MKTVIVKPERCVGCMQCRFECSVAHSRSKNRYLAISEKILSKPRIHIVEIENGESFPNKCRHCNPAPCEIACITKAIYRETKTDIVLINPERCINCGMCAMACPFGVIRYHKYFINKISAHKCDQCILRLSEGKVPACVSACKVGALNFGDINEEMDRETYRLAKLIYLGVREKKSIGGTFDLLKEYKTRLEEIRERRG
ncbi:MAG: 4Fe-4S dicluster domain-containing protein [Proteobacteria bacterium]|nr:4Fe-4S dicluster domain-containing protein [Pseudomonadota bacterium]